MTHSAQRKEPSLKNRFPFRLGTTSYILHDDLLPNVRFLKDQVDSIELLLFESDETSNYPGPEVLRELNHLAATCNLSYTVHLPLHIPLGTRYEAQRKKNTAIMLRAIEATRPLNPHAWELHLEPDENTGGPPSREPEAWQEACLRSLEEIKTGGGDPGRIGVEVLEYDFAYAWPVIRQAGFSYCLDIGHVWYRNFDEAWFLENILPKARSFHLHGFNEKSDHQGLDCVVPDRLDRFLRAVAALPDAVDRTVTIEVFSEEAFTRSLRTLQSQLIPAGG